VSAKSVLLFMSGGQAAISDEIICGAAVGGGCPEATEAAGGSKGLLICCTLRPLVPNSGAHERPKGSMPEFGLLCLRPKFVF
jgi:hypothetical protein